MQSPYSHLTLGKKAELAYFLNVQTFPLVRKSIRTDSEATLRKRTARRATNVRLQKT